MTSILLGCVCVCLTLFPLNIYHSPLLSFSLLIRDKASHRTHVIKLQFIVALFIHKVTYLSYLEEDHYRTFPLNPYKKCFDLNVFVILNKNTRHLYSLEWKVMTQESMTVIHLSQVEQEIFVLITHRKTPEICSSDLVIYTGRGG